MSINQAVIREDVGERWVILDYLRLPSILVLRGVISLGATPLNGQPGGQFPSLVALAYAET